MFADPELSLTLNEAYNIQMEIAGLRCAAGDVVAGYKVGCIGPGVIEQFGMSGPIHARLFRSEIHRSGETLRHKTFANPAIEGEMALRIGVDGEIAAAFERVATRAATVRMLGSGTMDAMAVAQGQLGVVCQHTVPDWDRLPGAAIILGAGGTAAQVEAGGVTWSVAGAPTAVADVLAALEGR